MILYFLFFTTVYARDPCNPGSYADTIDTCQQCPSGWFQHREDSLSCIECTSTNQFVDVQGATSCKSCPAGWVRDTNTACTICTGNTVRDSSSLVCTSCPRGYTRKDNTLCVECPVAATESTSCCPGSAMVNGVCSECPVGHYIKSPSDTFCTICPIGKTSSIGSNECLECPSGSGVNETSKLCYSCPPSTYSENGICHTCPTDTHTVDYGQTECTSCVSPWIHHSQKTPCMYNHSCPEGHDMIDGDCTACPSGRVRSLFQANCTDCPGDSIEQDNVCVGCKKGTISVGNICTNCTQGKYRMSGDSCKTCEPGKFGPSSGLQECVSCLPGKFQPSYGSTTCEECESGRYRTGVGGAYCSLCPLGYGSSNASTECELCSPGQSASQGECKHCAVGFYKPMSQSFASCVFCPEGWIASENGLDKCTICDIGKYSIYNRSYCESCPPGNVTNIDGLGASGCADAYKSCGAGRYGSSSDCKTCPAGWYSGKQQQQCDECAFGTFSVPGSAFCLLCEFGKYAFESRECRNCPSGQTSTVGVCVDCARGRYQPQTGQPSCIDCPSAKTTTNPGAIDVNDCEACESPLQIVSLVGTCTWCNDNEYAFEGECVTCPPGRDNVLRNAECAKCSPGSAGSGGVCNLCAPGFAAAAEGQSECTSCTELSEHCTGCSPGFYLTTSGCKECTVGQWSSAGQTKCSRCQKGTYQNLNGQRECKVCEIGKYMNELGASACHLCPAGFFQNHQESASCYECPIGRYANEGMTTICQTCPSGRSTSGPMSPNIALCEECPRGTYELNHICTQCPESTYQDQTGQTTCKSCTGLSLSPKGSTSVDHCFSIEDLKSYVFGLQGDTKNEKSFSSKCELRPNSVLLCPGCTCDDDARNGYWDGPLCDECRRGFATAKCTSKCPGYDGTNDASMCSGNGKCWYGMHGTGLCYCGGKDILDPSSSGVVVDVRTCPKGKICAGYGNAVQTRTSYKPLYYLLQYRQFSAFVLQINKYTPNRGHMWFRRFPPSLAYENTCSKCVGPWRGTFSTEIGFWNKDGDYTLFSSTSQTDNGFHGENCQHECDLCLNGGYCNNVPHPYRRTYTIEDTFVPQRTISIPSTTCLCPSILYDPNHMCCPNGFQPYVFTGQRNTIPYARFTKLPHVTSIKNEQRDYHIGTDLWLLKDTTEMIATGVSYRVPYYEPNDGLMYVSSGTALQKVPYAENGPYNKHVYYGSARDICRACPGLFGKGVVSRLERIETESLAEEFWWDNGIGALSRKCNGVGKCDFYARDRETEVGFMGSDSDYRRMHRGKKCDSTPIRTTLEESLQMCIDAAADASYVAFAEPYRGGIGDDMVQNVSGVGPWRTSDRVVAITNSLLHQGWAEDTSTGTYTFVESLPRPNTESDYMIYPTTTGTCIHYSSCESQVYTPEFSVFDVHVGHGAERLEGASFDRFDTCFTYQTNTSGARQFGLFQTKIYENGQDPFLGHLCPRGYFCTKASGDVGYKEACPVGYYQPYEGETRTNAGTHCSSIRAVVPPEGCTFNEATADPYDLVDKVCKRCKRSEWSAHGSYACRECPVGRVKKLSGNYDVASIQMMNIPTYIVPNVSPWYYIADEYGQEAIDCALVPPGMIHIPNANSKMTYSSPNFIAAVSCPYGMTSTPGTYMYDEFTSIEVQQSFQVYKEAITAPYMTFEPIAEFSISENRSCHCIDKLLVKSRSVCNLYAQQKEKQFVYMDDGPDGCWTHHAYPDYVFYVRPKGLGIPSPGLTNICVEATYRSNLMAQMIGQYCRSCPGNSMSGPESGLCTTCFANKLKLYLKEAIYMIASGSYIDMVECQGDCSLLPRNSSAREEYLLPFDAWKFRNVELDTLRVTGSCTKDIILAPFIETDVTMTLSQCIIACSMTEIYRNTNDEHPSANQWTMVGFDSDQCLCSKEVPTLKNNLWECKDATLSQIIWRIKKFKNNTGQTNWVSDGLPLCSTCSPGKFLTGVNGACESCPKGRFTSTSLESNANTCVKCQSGKYAPSIGMKGCLRCGVGQFQLLTGQHLCTDCPNGFYSDTTGSTLCKACPTGFLSKVEYCEACPSGYFGMTDHTSNKFNCTKCPKGYSQPHEAQTSCDACAKGFYENEIGSVLCKKCLAGKFGDATRMTSESSCKDCLKGTYSSTDHATTCTACAYGQYQDQLGGASCKTCPGGTKCRVDSLGEACPSGTYTPKGTYLLDCYVCEDTGLYVLNADASKCIRCDEGLYVHDKGSNTCVSCGDPLWIGQRGYMTKAYSFDLIQDISTLSSFEPSIIATEILSSIDQNIEIRLCKQENSDEGTVYISFAHEDGVVSIELQFENSNCETHSIPVSGKSVTPIAIIAKSNKRMDSIVTSLSQNFASIITGDDATDEGEGVDHIFMHIKGTIQKDSTFRMNLPPQTSIAPNLMTFDYILGEFYARAAQIREDESIDRYITGCLP